MDHESQHATRFATPDYGSRTGPSTTSGRRAVAHWLARLGVLLCRDLDTSLFGGRLVGQMATLTKSGPLFDTTTFDTKRFLSFGLVFVRYFCNDPLFVATLVLGGHGNFDWSGLELWYLLVAI